MKAIIAFLGVLICSYVMVLSAVDVDAAEPRRWVGGAPVVKQAISAEVIDNASCPVPIRNIAIQGEAGSVGACMYWGQTLSLGVFKDGDVFGAAVTFAHDAQMYSLEGVCRENGCQYSVDQDLLITQHRSGESDWKLTIYRHASQRVKRVLMTNVGETRYIFDTSNPDYEMRGDDGQLVATGSYALSSNGKWLGVEIPNRGVALMDTQTFAWRQISVSGHQYGAGADPIEELAVSNDGRNVIVTGLNVGFMIFDIVDGCEQRLVGTVEQLLAAVPCPGSDLAISSLFPDLRVAHRPAFNETGDSFSLDMLLHGQTLGRKVVFGAAATTNNWLKVLALGDSFVSGEGENDESQYVSGTNSGIDNCHISRRSYPLLLGRSMGFPDADVKSVACAGARMLDITASTKNYNGQNDRGAQTSSRETTMREFLPGKLAQSTFVGAYRPDIITVGVGGNDAGLMGKLRVCAMPGTCEWAVGEGKQKSAQEIKGLFDRLVSLYEELSRYSPASRIYAFGYPDIINPYGTCDTVTTVLFTTAERVYMQESVRYLNQVISMAAAQAGVKYIEIQDSFGATRLCDGFASQAMNGVMIGDDMAPISALPQLKVIGSGSFHPKPAGHQLISDTVMRDYPGLSEYQWCSSGILVCPVNIGVPEPGDYWQVDEGYKGVRAYVEDFATIIRGVGDRLRISLQTMSVMPGTQIRVELHSDVTVLGMLEANSTGGADGELIIPSSVQPGPHTLHAVGTSIDGTAIDIYQFVDIDEAGKVTLTSVAGLTSDAAKKSAVQKYDASSYAGSVLGAQTEDDTATKQVDTSTASVPIDRVTRTARRLSDATLIGILVVAGLLVTTLLLLFLLWRRWVKRQRSV